MKRPHDSKKKRLAPLLTHVLFGSSIFFGMSVSASAMNTASLQALTYGNSSGGGVVWWLWILVIGVFGVVVMSPLNARKLTLHLRILFGKAHENCYLAGLRVLHLAVIIKTMAEIRANRCRLGYLLVKKRILLLRLRYLYFKRDVVVHKGGWLKVFSSTND